MNIIRWQTASGHDLSDHYGLDLRQARVLQNAWQVDPRPIATVQVELLGFYCLEVTDGTVPGTGDDDEVLFTLTGMPEAGAPQELTPPIKEDIINGTMRSFASPPRLIFDDPGQFFEAEVKAEEVDSSLFGETGRVPLGPGRFRWSRTHLQAVSGSEIRVLPLLEGDNGQYVVTVKLTVTRK